MCFSANASFVASAVIGVVGLATLRHVREVRSALFGSVPLLFSAHQFSEGLVWLSVGGTLRPDLLIDFVLVFLTYAQGILPVLMPMAVLLMEPNDKRRSIAAAFTLCGAALFLYVVYGLIQFSVSVRIEDHSLLYYNEATTQTWFAVAYVITTCGALLTSTHRVVRWFGLFNVFGVAGTFLIRHYAFTSVWCFYAATLSMIVYWQFKRGHIDITFPNTAHSPL